MKQLQFPSNLEIGNKYMVINNITRKCFIDTVENIRELTRSFEYYLNRFCPDLLKDIEKYGEDCFKVFNLDKMSKIPEYSSIYEKREYKHKPRTYYYLVKEKTYVSASKYVPEGRMLESKNREVILELISELDDDN